MLCLSLWRALVLGLGCLILVDANHVTDNTAAGCAQDTKGRATLRLKHETPTIGTGSILGGGFSRIEIRGKIDGDKGEGELQLDVGARPLDDFGDPTGEALPVSTTPITFALDARKDTKGLGRRLYRIRGEALPKNDPGFFLVVDELGKTVTLVVKEGKRSSSLPLSPAD